MFYSYYFIVVIVTPHPTVRCRGFDRFVLNYLFYKMFSFTRNNCNVLDVSVIGTVQHLLSKRSKTFKPTLNQIRGEIKGKNVKFFV